MTTNQNVLIVGGSGGIGSAVARCCAAADAWPVVGYCGRADRADQVVKTCGRGETVQLDLSSDDFTNVDGLRPIDSVVFAAAMFHPGSSLLEVSDEKLGQLLNVNMLSPIRLIKALLNAGHKLRDVVFILSTASFGQGKGPYALSKIGELAVSRLLVNELAVRGVRVNAIAPGWTETPMAAEAARAPGRSLDELRASHLDGRLLMADEIGKLCAEMLLDNSADMTGRLVVWDRRESREPVWLSLDAVFCADELAWTLPSAAACVDNH